MSSTDTTSSAAQDEAKIRELITQWRDALCAKDFHRMMTHYALEVLLYEITTPYQHQGAEAYRQSWEACAPFLPPSMGSEVHDLKIKVSGDLAFAHLLHRLTNKETGGPATCNWVRVTVCYERQNGEWKVVHEHVSVPIDPATSKAVFIDKP